MFVQLKRLGWCFTAGLALVLLLPMPGAAQTVVNNEADLQAALSNQSTTSIVFNADITLTGNLPSVFIDGLTIDGQGHALSGNNLYRGFAVGSLDGMGTPVTVTIQNITIANTVATGGAGGSGVTGGGGGAGLGGALFIDSGANVTVRNVILSGNSATGGAGGAGSGAAGPGGSAGGGGGMITAGANGTVGFGGNGGDGFASASGGTGGGGVGGNGNGASSVGAGGGGSTVTGGGAFGGQGAFGGGGGGTDNSLPAVLLPSPSPAIGGVGGFGGGGGVPDPTTSMPRQAASSAAPEHREAPSATAAAAARASAAPCLSRKAEHSTSAAGSPSTAPR